MIYSQKNEDANIEKEKATLDTFRDLNKNPNKKALPEKSTKSPSTKVDFQPSINIVDQLILDPSTVQTLSKSIETRKNGYRKVKDGGLECFHKEELKCQEGIVLDLMKSAGKQLMEGKNVVGISLPVRIFEPRSTIERICDWWAFGPIYLTRAARIKVYSLNSSSFTFYLNILL